MEVGDIGERSKIQGFGLMREVTKFCECVGPKIKKTVLRNGSNDRLIRDGRRAKWLGALRSDRLRRHQSNKEG